MAVCFGEFCDVFRCRNYLKIRRKKNKNIRNAFTKIMGSQEALYDLGINVHNENEFEFQDKDSKALMTMPAPMIMKVLDQTNPGKPTKNFIVGVGKNCKSVLILREFRVTQIANSRIS